MNQTVVQIFCSTHDETQYCCSITFVAYRCSDAIRPRRFGCACCRDGRENWACVTATL